MPQSAKKKEKKDKVNPIEDGIFADLDFADLGQAVIVKGYEPFEGLSSGSISVDWAVGNGKGFPRGQVTQISGPRGAGKTSLYMLTAANTIGNGGRVAIMDMEYRFNVEHAYHSGMGYPGKNYMLVHPLTAEDALNYAVYFAKNGFDMGVIDSVGGMSPKSEIEGEVGDSSYAAIARIFSQFFRMRMSDIWKSPMALIFINQIRTKMNVTYGNPNTRMGGKALEYYTSVGLELEAPSQEETEYDNAEDQKERKNYIGITITGKTWKNSVCQPSRKIEVPIRFVKGVSINTIQEVKDFGASFGVFRSGTGGKPTGATNWFHGDTKYSNASDLENELMSNPDMLGEVIQEIKEAMQNGY